MLLRTLESGIVSDALRPSPPSPEKKGKKETPHSAEALYFLSEVSVFGVVHNLNLVRSLTEVAHLESHLLELNVFVLGEEEEQDEVLQYAELPKGTMKDRGELTV